MNIKNILIPFYIIVAILLISFIFVRSNRYHGYAFLAKKNEPALLNSVDNKLLNIKESNKISLVMFVENKSQKIDFAKSKLDTLKSIAKYFEHNHKEEINLVLVVRKEDSGKIGHNVLDLTKNTYVFIKNVEDIQKLYDMLIPVSILEENAKIKFNYIYVIDKQYNLRYKFDAQEKIQIVVGDIEKLIK